MIHKSSRQRTGRDDPRPKRSFPAVRTPLRDRAFAVWAVWFGLLLSVTHPDGVLPVRAAAQDLLDKTLVVWVRPANSSQRGGSALTLDDLASHFDGIVFGEIAAGRWMAGSDFYRRTWQDQAAWPA